MVWSNWQGAIGRGALVVLLFWSGLAWTQTSAPKAASDPAERIMVVHENGKSTRCRVMETWKLPDGRVAHLLQAIDTSEMITIVDEVGSTPESTKNPRAMPKRIFNWGHGRSTPPEGSPLPPHMRLDSGVTIKHETLPPIDAVPEGPVILNKGVKGKPMMDGPMIVQKKAPTLRERLFGRRDASDPQVVDFRNNTSSASSPSIENKLPPPPKALVGAPRIETPPPQIIERVGVPTLPKPPANLKASDSPGITSTSNEVCDSGITESTRRIEIPAKKTWHPGANIQNWAQGRSTPSAPKMEITQAPIVYKDRTESQKFEDRRLEKVETHLAQQNRIAEKQLAERVEKSYQPFSTAKAPGTNMSLPEAPKPSGQPFSTARPSEIKKPTPSPLAMVDEKPGVLPPAPMPKNPSTDMWGNPKSATGLEPGSIRPELTKVPAPPSTRPDPLFAPERLIAGGGNSDTVKPAAVPVAPPMMRPAPEPGTLPNPPEPTGMARPSWPVGTQSVQAASSGMAPMYIPVPTVTVPQPIHPPVPPPPNMPEAPQLNAYVNAFTPPPAPKGQQQPMPTMAQQMMYQQMMAQQQMIAQHQMLMQYGYRPNPMMSPYMPVPTSGPMANFSRHYMGPMPPMAPNPFNVSVTGYQPWSYPQMPPMQQTSYQQPAPPAPQQPVTMQVEQLIKTMRESPYPAQRELAAQSLIGFEWRAHPQIVPALVQSASQDPAASVRAGCANCLGRMNANVEPAIGVLNGLRNDIDQRVRTEAEQALVRLGQKE